MVAVARVQAMGILIDAPKQRSSCLPGPGQEFIPFNQVLWISPEGESTKTLTYAKGSGSDKYTVKTIKISLASGENDVSKLLDLAYGPSKRQKRLLVLINPFGGQGKAQSIFQTHGEPMFRAARCEVDIKLTEYRHHAEEIAATLVLDAYDAIVCCSGDGIPHEVLNGLANHKSGQGAKALRKVAVCQFPCGSGNALAVSFNGSASPSLAALNIVKGVKTKMDLMNINQTSLDSNKRYVSFLSQTYGLVADCDLGTENLRWMGGQRFAVGAVMRVLSLTKYPCEVYVEYAHEKREQVTAHFAKYLDQDSNEQGEGSQHDDSAAELPKVRSVKDPVPDDWVKIERPDLCMFYVGKLPWMSSDALMFPATLPADGLLDMVLWDTSAGRIKSLNLLTAVESGKHYHVDQLQYSKITAFRLIPKIDSGYLSIDGEAFPFEPLQVEVLPGAGCFLSATGGYSKTLLHDHCRRS